MEWFNVFGLVFISLIMIPNVIFAIRSKDGFENKYHNKRIELVEQVGRFGCICFMMFNIPGTWFGWWSDEAFVGYIIVNALLIVVYCGMWIVFRKKNNQFRALVLSVIPSVIFLFSGVMSRSVLLLFSACLFAPSHIIISCKNAE